MRPQVMTWPVRHDEVFGCQRWSSDKDSGGYGRHSGKLAHRVVWEESLGPIPAGMEIEHICRRRDCVALKHLELFTRSQQERAKSWRRRSKRECPNGCDMTTMAMVTPEGGRLCRECER